MAVLLGTSLWTMTLLRLRTPKGDVAAAIRYLDYVEQVVMSEINDARAETYFKARLEGQFEEALQAGTTSRKRALRMVRSINKRLGCPIRWRDGADPTSTFRTD